MGKVNEACFFDFSHSVMVLWESFSIGNIEHKRSELSQRQHENGKYFPCRLVTSSKISFKHLSACHSSAHIFPTLVCSSIEGFTEDPAQV